MPILKDDYQKMKRIIDIQKPEAFARREGLKKKGSIKDYNTELA